MDHDMGVGEEDKIVRGKANDASHLDLQLGGSGWVSKVCGINLATSCKLELAPNIPTTNLQKWPCQDSM